MTSSITPSWTDSATTSILVAPQILGRNYVTRATLDLSTKVGAYLVCLVGRTHTTGITSNFFVKVRRMALAKSLSQPGGLYYTGGSTTGSTVVAVQNTTVATGVTVIPMTASPTGFGSQHNYICFCGHTQPSNLTHGVTVPAEFCDLVARWANTVTTPNEGTSIWVDAPLKYSKLAGEVCSNQAEVVGPVWLEGGCQYEVVFDYGAATGGEALVIASYYQSYDSDSVS